MVKNRIDHAYFYRELKPFRIEAIQNRSSSESSRNRIDHTYFYRESKPFRIGSVQKRSGSESSRFKIQSGMESSRFRYASTCTASILNRLDLCDGFDSERSKLGGCRFFPASILNQLRDDLCVCLAGWRTIVGQAVSQGRNSKPFRIEWVQNRSGIARPRLLLMRIDAVTNRVGSALDFEPLRFSIKVGVVDSVLDHAS